MNLLAALTLSKEIAKLAIGSYLRDGKIEKIKQSKKNWPENKMSKFSFLIFILFTVFIYPGTGTAFGASGLIGPPSLQENLTNQSPDPVPPDRPPQNVESNNLTDVTASGASGLIESSALQVNLTNQNPDPARPGESAELTVSVQNIGSNNLKDITVAVKPEYPFSQVSGEALEKSISYLNARQDDNDATVLKFKLMTDSNASQATYDIDVTTTAKASGSSSNIITTTKTFHLEVRGKEYAQIVTINKANIDVGKEEPLEFIITNTGNSPLKNMVISWKDPKGVILPVYSDNTKYIKYLEPNKSVKVDYFVMADVSATPGLYALDVNLAFEDYQSDAKLVQTTAGLFVGGPTDFDVSFSENSEGKVSLSVANVGNNEAYAVKLSIPEQNDYKVMGGPSTIVGNLEKGDYTIATFNVTSTQSSGYNPGSAPSTADTSPSGKNLTSTSMDQSSLKVQIEYTDAKGERITVKKDVAVPASGFSTGIFSETEDNRSSGLDSSITYIVLIVIVGTGVLLYRRRKQREKKAD